MGAASSFTSRGKGVLVIADGLLARLVALKPDTLYTVTVAASTVAGTGVSSDPVQCSTMEDGKFLTST